MSLSERIVTARLQAGLSKTDLAKKLGLTPAAIHLLETGQTQALASSNVFSMADALGVSARWLVTGMQGSEKPEFREESLQLLRKIEGAEPEVVHAILLLLQK